MVRAANNRPQTEIERLQKENNQFADLGKMYSEIRAEAIKEFAELIDKDIEEKLSNSIKEQNPDLYLIHRIIKDRLKEMMGE